jgi:hypothetical protein
MTKDLTGAFARVLHGRADASWWARRDGGTDAAWVARTGSAMRQLSCSQTSVGDRREVLGHLFSQAEAADPGIEAG